MDATVFFFLLHDAVFLLHDALQFTSCKRIIPKLNCQCVKSVFLAGYPQRLLTLMSSPDSDGLQKFLLNPVASVLKLFLMTE